MSGLRLSRRQMRLAIIYTPLAGLAAYKLHRLGVDYPGVPPTPDHALLIPRDLKTHKISDVGGEVFYARVPKAALEHAGQEDSNALKSQSLQERWARHFLTTGTMRLEGRVIGLLRGRDETDEAAKFEKGDVVFNGVMTVENPPTGGSPLVVSWTLPDAPVRIFERLASWGYPWRLMTGGKHSWEVITDELGDPDYVKVGFGCAHQYQKQNRFTEEEDGKEIPKWVAWAHRRFAQALLHSAVKALPSPTSSDVSN